MNIRLSLSERPYLLACVTALLGVVFVLGGTRLALLGGSTYYVLTGVLYLIVSVLVWRRSVWGDRVYALSLLATLAWSLSEVGIAPWGLLPRLLLPALLGIWVAAPWKSLRAGPIGYSGTIGVLSLFLLIAAFARPQWERSAFPLPPSQNKAGVGDNGDWHHYGNTLAGTRFSPLDQINASNVKQLEVAWMFRSGETYEPVYSAESTPLKIGDTLYTCTPNDMVVALDPETGKEKWRVEPKLIPSPYPIKACRGVSYYAAPTAVAECPTRILFGTMDHRLMAVDAATGAPCKGFGTDGTVSLADNIGQIDSGIYGVTSPPAIVKGHVVVGTLIADNQALDMPSGVIRSFDPIDGHLQWAWDMGVPDRIGAPPPGETYTRSTPNGWSIFSADEDLGLVYVPTGNPSPDSYGLNRRPFDEKYSSSVVALDIETGRPRWSFQTVHHDLWDYDTSAQPTLIDFPTPDGPRPAVIQATKRGDIYVLDRRTGQPIVPVGERSVPTGGLPENWLSKTQPFSALSLPIPQVTEASMWGATPIDQMICRTEFRQSRYDGIFTPPGTDMIVQQPGLTGVVDWGGVSIDLDRGVLVTNYMNMPWRGRLIPKTELTEQFVASHTAGMMRGSPYAWRFGPWLSDINIPCMAPPWGRLIAIDLGTQRVLWDRPLGTAEDSGPFGIPTHLPLTIGVPSLSGTLTTRGGLIFISGTADRYVRAIDEATGEEIWHARLPAGAQATPMTYMAGGRQYLLVTSGGNMLMQSKFGDYTIAYVLPKR